MDGVLGVAYTVFKYGAGFVVGFVGVCIFIYLVLIIIGLFGVLIRNRREKKTNKAVIRSPLVRFDAGEG